MKNFMLTILFIVLSISLQAQLKVSSDGIVRAKNKTLIVGEDSGTSEAKVMVGYERAQNGSTSFLFYNSANPGYSDWTLKMASNSNGYSTFTHKGVNPFALGTTQNTKIALQTNNLNRMIIEGSGTVNVFGDLNATGGNTVSDKRLKKNINNFKLGLETLIKIEPKEYYYNGKSGISTTRQHVGVIAQDFKKLVPPAVEEYTYENQDVKGNYTGRSEKYLMVDEKYIQYILVNSVKELKILVDKQENHIIDLENEIESLKQTIKELNIDNTNSSSSQIGNVNGNSAFTQKIVSVNPNPFDQHVEIHYQIPINLNYNSANLLIFDLSGRLVLEKPIHNVKNNTGVFVLDGALLTSGVYYCKLGIDGKEFSEAVKFVKN